VADTEHFTFQGATFDVEFRRDDVVLIGTDDAGRTWEFRYPTEMWGGAFRFEGLRWRSRRPHNWEYSGQWPPGCIYQDDVEEGTKLHRTVGALIDAVAARELVSKVRGIRGQVRDRLQKHIEAAGEQVLQAVREADTLIAEHGQLPFGLERAFTSYRARLADYHSDHWRNHLTAEEAEQLADLESGGYEPRAEAYRHRPVKKRRLPEGEARTAIESFLSTELELSQEEAEQLPLIMVPEGHELHSPAGECGWAFWLLSDDTTSYLHEDFTVEWYGTAYRADRTGSSSAG